MQLIFIEEFIWIWKKIGQGSVNTRLGKILKFKILAGYCDNILAFVKKIV